MSLGVYNTYIGSVNQGDTAELKAYLDINGQPVTQDQVTGVGFKIQTPLVGQQIAQTVTLPVTTIPLMESEGVPPTGSIYAIDTDNNIQQLSYTGVSGNTLTGVTGGIIGSQLNQYSILTFTTFITQSGIVLSDGAGFLRYDTTGVTLGGYEAMAQFSLLTGERRSVKVAFAVIDPFNPPLPSEVDQITEGVLMRLEDCFDSTEGGPWLRDRTMSHFDASKVANFIPEALLDINVQMPPTNFTLGMFTSQPGAEMNPNQPLLIKGVLCLTIRHLMRSYTEIFTPTGQGQLVWPDRTRYQQAWGQIYQIEYQDYIAALRLWKRTEYRFGQSALLTFSKAGRLYPFAGQSTRGIYRGWT